MTIKYILRFSHIALVGVFAASLLQASTPLDWGVQFRSRYQVQDPGAFAPAASQRTTDMLLFRTRVWGQTDIPDKNISVFIQMQDSRTSGTEASVAANSANVDLHQGYLDILSLFGKPVDLRVGRQELKYGDQRLISTLEWSNVGRAWDGAKVTFAHEDLTIDAFVTVVSEISDFYEDSKFSGVYSQFSGLQNHELDFYVLSLHSGKGNTTTGSGASLNLNNKTVGARLKGKHEFVDYSGEVIVQGGKTSGMDINAHALALTAGVTADDVKGKPRIGFGTEFASGDDNPTDNEFGTFNPLFPFGHYYQGHADVVGWRNLHDTYVNATAKLFGQLWSQLAFHQFRLAEAKDAWYSAGGTAVAQDVTGSSGKKIGTEIDIHFKIPFRDVIKLWFGYAHFFADDFVKRTVGDKDKDFAFLQGVINFGGVIGKQ